MEVLNDDCQLKIIEYLNLTDQLALLEAAKEDPENRLNSNVRYFWHRKLTFSIDSGHFMKFEEKPDIRDDFLCSMSPTVHKLDLPLISLRNLALLSPYQFPNMKTLEYSLEKYDDERIGNITLQTMSELFPKLLNIKPHGSFNCIQFSNYLCLQSLDLSFSWFYFNEIELRKVPTLEELHIATELYEELSKILMSLPRFRKLTYQFDCEQPQLLEDLRIQDIEKMTFNDCIWEFRLPTLKSMINLRELRLLDDDSFTAPELYDLISDLPRLECLHLIDFPIWKSERELWRIVASCPTLKILNISGMALYVDFFHINRRPMRLALQRRSTALTLHCYNTGPNEHLIRRYFRHPKLNISFNDIYVDYFHSHCVQIDFLPLTAGTTPEKTS